MPDLRRVFFQSKKLVATVLPPGSRPRICPSDTCCPQGHSQACRVSLLIPPAGLLRDDDLRQLITDLRTKMNAEQQGVEIVLATRSEEHYSNTTKTLKAVIGPAVDVPK